MCLLFRYHHGHAATCKEGHLCLQLQLVPSPLRGGGGDTAHPGSVGTCGAHPSPRSCPLAQVPPCRWESGAGRAAGPVPHQEGKWALPLHSPQHPGTVWRPGMAPTAGTPVGTHLSVRLGSAAGPCASKANAVVASLLHETRGVLRQPGKTVPLRLSLCHCLSAGLWTSGSAKGGVK